MRHYTQRAPKRALGCWGPGMEWPLNNARCLT